MKRKLFLFFTLFLAGIGILVAQTQVRGTVVDESGEPIIGATVQVKGTAQGTVTDLDGQFYVVCSGGCDVRYLLCRAYHAGSACSS